MQKFPKITVMLSFYVLTCRMPLLTHFNMLFKYVTHPRKYPNYKLVTRGIEKHSDTAFIAQMNTKKIYAQISSHVLKYILKNLEATSSNLV